jgi:outer membrane protein OmpA-like peptidoglycan-associated protein
MQKALFILLIFSQLSFSQGLLKHNVYFQTAEHKIVSSEEGKFNQFLAKLDSIYIDKITIFGFCDDRGSVSYNNRLSEKRANAVKRFFIDHEIPESLITVLDGKGELALDSISGNIDQIRRNNRRVDIFVQSKKEKEKDSLEIPTAQEILRGDINVGDKIRLKNIYFKTGYSTIVPESIPTLKEVAQILVEKENVYFTIQGHVCCTHDTYDAVDRSTNKKNLSVSRAKFIYNYLLRRGVEKHRMKYVGLRRKFPLGRDPKYDRRVEILITYISDRH